MNYFSVLLGIGASFGLLRITQTVERWQVSRWINIGLFIQAGMLLGARLNYILFYFNYYKTHLLEIPQFWLGGLAWPGAILGGFAVLLWFKFRWSISLLKLLDGVSVLVPPVMITAWLGCWFSGSAYGFLTPQDAWWGFPTLTETGQLSQRVPLQLSAALLLTLYFLWLERRRLHLREIGEISVHTYCALFAFQLMFSFLRADPAPLWVGLRPDSWFALLFLMTSLFLIKKVYYNRPDPS